MACQSIKTFSKRHYQRENSVKLFSVHINPYVSTRERFPPFGLLSSRMKHLRKNVKVRVQTNPYPNQVWLPNILPACSGLGFEICPL